MENFMNLSPSQCGRCTSVCPANITVRTLPRKIFIDYRGRFNELHKHSTNNETTTTNTYLRGYGNRRQNFGLHNLQCCAQECPVNINHPSLIVDARRYLVMEEGSAPGSLSQCFPILRIMALPGSFQP